MKVRHVQRHGEEKIELQMTPMIDIVFLMLIFFIMTFKIASPEGDFSIKMPRHAPREGLPDDSQLPPITVRMQADSEGRLKSIRMGQKALGNSIDVLHGEIRNLIVDDRGPGSFADTAEVELDCDYQLKYEYVMRAITAISGYIDPNSGRVIRVIEKIKFAPPRGE